MSNISQAGKNIKKKLSFEDYSKPAQQDAVSPAGQSASAPAGQQNTSESDKQAYQQDGKVHMPASKRTSTMASQQASKTVSQSAVVPKIKATFYLSNADNQLLTDMFIKRLQDKNKTDKSALIAEAIGLLYKREMKS